MNQHHPHLKIGCTAVSKIRDKIPSILKKSSVFNYSTQDAYVLDYSRVVIIRMMCADIYGMDKITFISRN